MAYLDDVRAERAQWALEEHQAHQDSAADSYEPSAADGVRNKAVCSLFFGLCLAPTPLFPFGVLFTALGAGLILIVPVLRKQEADVHQATVEQVRAGTGRGCGAFVWAMLVATGLIVGIGLLAGLLATTVAHGGLR